MVEVLGLYVQEYLWFKDHDNGYLVLLSQSLISPDYKGRENKTLNYLTHCLEHDGYFLGVTDCLDGISCLRQGE